MTSASSKEFEKPVKVNKEEFERINRQSAQGAAEEIGDDENEA
jgi:hypothetical protein